MRRCSPDSRRPPPEVGWWVRPAEADRRRTPAGEAGRYRVRVLAEPPTDYQRWLLWTEPVARGSRRGYPVHADAQASDAACARSDWWLLDDERVVVTAVHH